MRSEENPTDRKNVKAKAAEESAVQLSLGLIGRLDQGYTTSFQSPMHAGQEPAVSALLGYHTWFTDIAESS